MGLERSEPVHAAADAVIRGVLLGLAVVATSTGVGVALRGPAFIPGGSPTVPSNDSVLRFYAVGWAAQGPALWLLARDPELDRARLEAICATTFLGGLARLQASRSSGRPHPLFRALTFAELVLPPVLVGLRRL